MIGPIVMGAGEASGVHSFVIGGPAPTKGSVIPIPGSGRVRQSCRFLKEWTTAAQWAARGAGIRMQAAGGVAVRIVFHVPRPGPRSKLFGCVDPEVVPDVDKVARAICDALKGIAFEDDRQITQLIVEKEWTDPEIESVSVTVAKRFRVLGAGL
jgi:Holliday junction resolvase RusA-like endonuclease